MKLKIDKNHLTKNQLAQIITRQGEELSTSHAEIATLKAMIATSQEHDQEQISLKNILLSLPGNIFWKNNKGAYLGCNNNLAKLLGLHSPEEIVNKHNSDLFDPAIALPLDKIDQEVIYSDKEMQIEEQGINENKQPAVYLTRKIPLHNSKGEVIGLLGASFDITERKKREEMQLFSLRSIVNLLPGNIYWKTKEGIYLGCNKNVAEFLGLPTPEDIIGKHNKDILDEKTFLQLEAIDQEILSSGQEKITEELNFHYGNPPPTIFLTHKKPLRNPAGEIVGLIGVSFDITDRKKTEAELQTAKEQAETANRAKTQMIAVTNHELRTPLTSILGLISFLKKNNLPPEEEKYTIDTLETCAQHLLDIVNDVLDFSRLETGKYMLTLKPLHLPTLINEITSMLTPIAEGKKLKLQVDATRNIPAYIVTDDRLLRHMLINLINNAIKFTHKGSIILRIRCQEPATPQAQLNFAVIDSGQGIPEDKLDIIFEPFQQLEDLYIRSLSTRGTGLGLTIVKKFAALIDMDVNVESELGKGSTFTLSGNFKSYEEEPSSLNIYNMKKIPPIHNSKRALKIMLIEDDPIVQHVHKKMLAEFGCHVDVAASGQEAIQKFNHHHVIFVDISLPDISGPEVIKIIRERYNSHKPIIITLTAYAEEHQKDICLQAGADEFMTKPVTLDALNKVLERYTTPTTAKVITL